MTTEIQEQKLLEMATNWRKRVLLPIARPPEHLSVAGLLSELPIAGVILDVLVLEVHVEVLDAAFAVRHLHIQKALKVEHSQEKVMLDENTLVVPPFGSSISVVSPR